DDEFFPAGSGPGSCLHEIFESISFCGDESRIRDAASSALERYGIDSRYCTSAVTLVAGTLHAQLPHGGALSDLSDAQVLKEMEFYFPAKVISCSAVQQLFRKHSASFNGGYNPSLDHLDFLAFTGFLKGYIDCIFEQGGKYYIIDWKSNDLGSSAERYAGKYLMRAMDEHRYTLQCHIYALALHRYLKMRIPDYSYEKYFGGVYYLFLRGMRFGEGAGIWQTRPSIRFISDLEALCIRTREEMK
ncbi:MAG: PD-(D/E)XK nuclease family protein, partial [Spirochaetota bacterium]